jgi:nickel-dependent lactate racemase
MRTLSIPYGEGEVSFHVAESHPLYVLQPRWPSPVRENNVSTLTLTERFAALPSPLKGEVEKTELRRALDEPIGALGLAHAAHAAHATYGARRVVILADDLTRPTPVRQILPLLLDQLNAGGVRDEQVTVLVALGTHRPMTLEEIDLRFGAEVTRRVAVLNHPWQDPAQMVDLGTTSGGTPLQVSRLALEANFLLGIGSIVPHHIPGFSGGAKIVQPGISGAATTGATHLFSTRTRRSYLGMLENPVRAEMESIAEQVGLKAIFNTVLGPDGGLVGAFYGEPRQTFRRGASLAAQVWGAPLQNTPPVDVVVAGSHPCDIEFWQAHKALYPADMILKDGGTLVLVTPCPEGVSVMHPEMLEYAGLPPEEILKQIEIGVIPDVAAGALALAWAKVRQRVHVSLVSGGISPAAARALGFQLFDSVQAALDEGFRRHGAQASVAVLPLAPDTLPIV